MAGQVHILIRRLLGLNDRSRVGIRMRINSIRILPFIRRTDKGSGIVPACIITGRPRSRRIRLRISYVDGRMTNHVCRLTEGIACAAGETDAVERNCSLVGAVGLVAQSDAVAAGGRIASRYGQGAVAVKSCGSTVDRIGHINCHVRIRVRIADRDCTGDRKLSFIHSLIDRYVVIGSETVTRIARMVLIIHRFTDRPCVLTGVCSSGGLAHHRRVAADRGGGIILDGLAVAGVQRSDVVFVMGIGAVACIRRGIR